MLEFGIDPLNLWREWIEQVAKPVLHLALARDEHETSPTKHVEQVKSTSSILTKFAKKMIVVPSKASLENA